jgi:hypothetical protein
MYGGGIPQNTNEITRPQNLTEEVVNYLNLEKETELSIDWHDHGQIKSILKKS